MILEIFAYTLAVLFLLSITYIIFVETLGYKLPKIKTEE